MYHLGVWMKLWRAAGAWPGYAAVARRLVRTDRWLSRITGGRLVALRMAPSFLLTTTGRRSGQPRSNPLQYVKDGPDFIVIASNWGGANDPAWALNLRAEPRAVVTLGGRREAVLADEVDGADRDRLWKMLVDQWPGYELYRARAPHRRFPIFRLTPTAEHSASS